MSDIDDTPQDATFVPGPGVTEWLRLIVGAARTSRAVSKPWLPGGLAGDGISGRQAKALPPKSGTPSASSSNGISSDTGEIDVRSMTMVVIDLDVSVGTDDAETLKTITLTFSGLPDGASLSAGENNDGVWSVPATELSDLSIVIPEDTADFDLDVEMQVAGNEPQSASIHVENATQQADPGSAFKIRLAPLGDGTKSRISVYADGVVAFDRILHWPDSDERDVEVLVPYADDALPFEIVMRYDDLEQSGGTAPMLLGVEVDGVDIAPDSASISAQGSVLHDAMIWQGDLVLDVRLALKPEQNSAAPDDFVADDTAPTPEATDETLPLAVHDDTNEVAAEDDNEAIGPQHEDVSVPTEELEPTAQTGVLIMDASFADLQRQAFVKELCSLRDFIRSHASDDTGEIYSRLGIDVAKWHDMTVYGPTGAEVVLDPLLARLAPRGGIDNTRDLQRFKLPRLPHGMDLVVRVSGLPPGALLTRGVNNGDGVWQISANDIQNLSVLPAIGSHATSALHVAWNDGGGGKDKNNISLRKSFLTGPRIKRPEIAGNEMATVSIILDQENFDPNGHGALSLTIGEMPSGSLLERGKNHGGGVWTVELKSGNSLTLNVPRATKPFSIALTCVALDAATGDSTVVSRVIDVSPLVLKAQLRASMAA